VKELSDKVEYWYVPLGNKYWFEKNIGLSNVIELDWWDSIEFVKDELTATIVCNPCQHFSGMVLREYVLICERKNVVR
jgi:L-ascorbate metabolism protein UlaG (beta-lactamase superfamily)